MTIGKIKYEIYVNIMGMFFFNRKLQSTCYNASLKSIELLQKEGKDNVNNFRLAIKYSCKPIYEM